MSLAILIIVCATIGFFFGRLWERNNRPRG
jgi:hypothetical protein